MILRVDEYERRKRLGGQAIAVEDHFEVEIGTIGFAEPPADAAQFDHEPTAGRGVES